MHPYLLLREDAPPVVEGRTLTCRICTYDKVYEPSASLRERVRRGAFKAPLARPSGILRYRHIGERPQDDDDLSSVHGLLVGLREEAGAVLADLEVFEGGDGDKLLALVRSGAITGVSMSAIIGESTRGRDGITDIRKVNTLNGVSLTPHPAYSDAMVLTREQQRDRAQRIQRAREELEIARRMLVGL